MKTALDMRPRREAMFASRNDHSTGGLTDGNARLTRREVTALVESLGNTHGHSHRVVFNALRDLGAVAMPVLINALQDPRATVRQDAANLLRRMALPADLAAPALIAALRDPDWLVRLWVAEALGKIAPQDPQVVAALRDAEHDSSPYVRHAAVLSLAKLQMCRPADN